MPRLRRYDVAAAIFDATMLFVIFAEFTCRY